MRRVLACACVSTFACGAPAVTSAPVEPGRALPERHAQPPTPACSLEASFPFITADEQQAKIAAFEAQNTGDWNIVPSSDMDGVFGYLRSASRRDSSAGKDPHADPEKVGRAFFEKNAVFLGFDPAEIKRAKYTSNLLAFSGPMRGFEGYDTAPLRVIHVTYSVVNGEVGGFQSLSSILPLSLDLCARPPGPPKLANVIGRELFYVPHVYVPPPPVPMGKVDEASITKREPVVFQTLDEKGQHFVLGWRLVVEREEHFWSFTVAGSDGALLEATH